MMYSTERPGRVIGGLIALQGIVASILASHPEADTIIRKMEQFPRGFEPTAEHNPEEFDFLGDISAGAQDMIDEIQSLVTMARTHQK